jgi:PKD repeat protein
VFQEAGSYSVYLKISNATLEDTVIKTDYIQVSTNTNVQFAGNSRLVVFPNPAKDFIYIRAPENQISVFDISISDMTGRRVLDTSPENNGSKIKIDIRSLEPGMYIVKIHYADGSVNSNKIVIKQD